MRTHGWAGQPPADDAEAVRRILDATQRCIDRFGPRVNLSDVARDLGITRQTVYRYFASTEDLLTASALDLSGEFLERLDRHLARRRGSLSDQIVEGLAFALETLPADTHLGAILADDRIGLLARGFTSPTALSLSRAGLERFPLDWSTSGLTSTDIDELVEHLLRVAQSFILDPGTPPRSGKALRRYLERWVAPAVDALLSSARQSLRD